MYTRLVRFPTAEDISNLVAQRLLQRLIELQATRERVHLCLTGGATADTMYLRFAELADGSQLDATKLQLWWGDERFVPATDPARNSLQAISRLARTVSIASADTHMMAARDGRRDPHEAAAEYEAELGETRFDITLLGMGADGHVASIYPDHPSFEPTNRRVIGVTDAPQDPPEQVTLTLPALSRSAEVWFLVTGGTKAEALRQTLGGDATLPAAHVRGEYATLFFVDEPAARLLPPQYSCPL